MNEQDEQEPITEPIERTPLTNAMRAVTALAPAGNEKQLVALRDQSTAIVSINSDAAYKECVTARKFKKEVRLHITKLGEAAREDAQAYSKAIIAEQKRLIAIIEPEEKRLQALQDAWDAKLEAEKREKQELEDRRVEYHRRRIYDIAAIVQNVMGANSVVITNAGEKLFAMIVPDDFQEFQEEAYATRADGLQRLHAMWLSASAHEQEVAKQLADAKELEEFRRLQAVVQASAEPWTGQIAMSHPDVVDAPILSGEWVPSLEQCAETDRINAHMAEVVVPPGATIQSALTEIQQLQLLSRQTGKAANIMFEALTELKDMKLSAKALKVVNLALANAALAATGD